MRNKFYHLELSHISDNDKYIIFLGDSYTWGQGLYLNHWIENKPEIFEHFYNTTNGFDTHLSWVQQEPFFGKIENEIKNNLSFTNIVAKKLNRNCYKSINNGGKNSVNLDFLKKFNQHNFGEKNVIVIFQFTTIGREDIHLTEEEANKLIRNNKIVDNIFKDKTSTLFDAIDNKLLNLKNELGWEYYYMDWLGEFYDFMPEKFITFGERKIPNISLLTNLYHNKILYKDRIFYDYHLNSKGNIFVADSIVNHIQQNLENW